MSSHDVIPGVLQQNGLQHIGMVNDKFHWTEEARLATRMWERNTVPGNGRREFTTTPSWQRTLNRFWEGSGALGELSLLLFNSLKQTQDSLHNKRKTSIYLLFVSQIKAPQAGFEPMPNI
jgi:hypothetical protein